MVLICIIKALFIILLLFTTGGTLLNYRSSFIFFLYSLQFDAEFLAMFLFRYQNLSLLKKFPNYLLGI